MSFSTSDTQNILRIALLAAFVDGEKHARERDAIRDIAQGLGASEGVSLPTLYQDVMLKRVDVAQAAAALSDDNARQMAYEMAVCVCEADGVASAAEHQFLAQLSQQLGLQADQAQGFEAQAESLTQAAAEPWGRTAVVAGTAAAVGAAAAWAAAPSAPAQPVAVSPSAPVALNASTTPRANVDQAELERQIRNAAITNGALELLPESLSTMAIIPLQIRLVYNIGKAHGYELDSGHIKDFLATLGVGMTSQYLEQAGRKLLGGLLKKVGGGGMLGGLAGGLGKQAISSGMSFASTYALGHVALQYYGGGRKLSTQMLKDTYTRVLGQGQQLQTQYLPEIQQKAKTINMTEIMNMVRGQKLG